MGFVYSILLLYCYTDTNTPCHPQLWKKWCQMLITITHHTPISNYATPDPEPITISPFVLPPFRLYRSSCPTCPRESISPILPHITPKTNFSYWTVTMMIHLVHLNIQWHHSQSGILYWLSLCTTFVLPLSHSDCHQKGSLQANFFHYPSQSAKIQTLQENQYNTIMIQSNPSQDPPDTHTNWIPTLTETPSLILSLLICLSLHTRFQFYRWCPSPDSVSPHLPEHSEKSYLTLMLLIFLIMDPPYPRLMLDKFPLPPLLILLLTSLSQLYIVPSLNWTSKKQASSGNPCS